MSLAIVIGTLSREKIQLEDVQDYATSDDFPGLPTDVTWMNEQLFNVLTRGVKNMSEKEGCYGAGAWVKLLRAYKRQERMQESETHQASP